MILASVYIGSIDNKNKVIPTLFCIYILFVVSYLHPHPHFLAAGFFAAVFVAAGLAAAAFLAAGFAAGFFAAGLAAGFFAAGFAAGFFATGILFLLLVFELCFHNSKFILSQRISKHK
jgi:hypothetical protein